MSSDDMSQGAPSHERWWAWRVLKLGWHLLLNYGSLLQLVRLLRLAPFFEACRYNPRFALKSLGQNYLARNLDARARLDCFIYHYERVRSSFPDHTLKMLLYWDIPLYEMTEEGHKFSLDLGSSRPYDKEGELSLLLKVDSLIIFTLTFTIIPAWVVGSCAADALLISRLQGERSCPDEIRLATKAMSGVRPRALLLAALQGIAYALGVEEIDAVSAREQTSYCGHSESSFLSSYDEFFAELGLKKNSSGFFSSRVPIPEKPLMLVDPNNRRTARKKQAFKGQIQMACAASLGQACGQTRGCLEFRLPQASEENTLEASTL